MNAPIGESGMPSSRPSDNSMSMREGCCFFFLAKLVISTLSESVGRSMAHFGPAYQASMLVSLFIQKTNHAEEQVK